MLLKKNDVIKLTIEELSLGKGIGRYENIVIFVPNSCPGDEAMVKIVKVKSHYCFGIIDKLLVPGKSRIKPKCNVSSKCGGCSYGHIAYDQEIQEKTKFVYDSLTRLGKLSEISVEDTLPSERVYKYRNKCQIPVGYDKNGNLTAGFYAPHSHTIIPCGCDCLLQPDLFKKVINLIIDWMREYNIKPYDEKSNTGLVRHIYLRYGEKSHQLMLCLVSTNKNLPNSNILIDKLKSKVKELTTLIINVNSKNTNVILGPKNYVIYGSGYIIDNLCGLDFKISPFSFYQVNHQQTENLYSIAKEYAGLNGSETVLDLFCGIGTIGLFMADKAKRVIGAEVIPQAVEDAKYNAQLNNISNAEFLEMDLTKDPEYFEKRGIKPDVVILDPPRKGCSESLIKTVSKISPQKVVYVSCNPTTLARDLQLFTTLNYNVEKVHSVDMFPRTEHVETVVLLGRKMVDDRNIEYEYVDYEPKDNEYMRNTKGSATYAEIKLWIKEQYNVSVSNLYIAQVKDSCGFEKRENYNTGAEGHKVPQCPDEKRKMILEAFKHFRMI